MSIYIDQLARSIEIPSPPIRIISLVPSITELLYDLGLEEETIGITKFCVRPAGWFHTKTRVGGTKNIKPEIIRQLRPDLIIANKEENVQSQVEELAQDFPVWISDVNTLEHALQMIFSLGEITGRAGKAQKMVIEIKAAFHPLKNLNNQQQIKAAYLIWRDPYMTIGGDTFINNMLEYAGFENVFSNRSRYPELTVEEIENSHARLILLASEPFPFKEKHVLEMEEKLPGIKKILVDGEMFSWYGSRLLLAPAYFKELSSRL